MKKKKLHRLSIDNYNSFSELLSRGEEKDIKFLRKSFGGLEKKYKAKKENEDKAKKENEDKDNNETKRENLTDSKELDDICVKEGCDLKHKTVREYNNAVNMLINILQNLFSTKISIRMSSQGYKHWVANYWFLVTFEHIRLTVNTHFPSMVIENFLYLGGLSTVCPESLKYLGIKFIINCTETMRTGQNVLNIMIKDDVNENIINYFDECYDFIEKARKKKEKNISPLYGRSKSKCNHSDSVSNEKK